MFKTACLALFTAAATLVACSSQSGAPRPPPQQAQPVVASPPEGGDGAQGDTAACVEHPNDRIYRFIDGEDACAAAMAPDAIAKELQDPFARGVLQKGLFPKTVDELVAAIGKAVEPTLSRTSYIVAEGGQIPTSVVGRDATRRGRYVIAWASRSSPEILVSSRVVLKDTFMEVIAWDEQKKSHNYYVYTLPEDKRRFWSWTGDRGRARAAATRGKGCFGCHHGGTLLMKELLAPWNNWHSTSAAINAENFPKEVTSHALWGGREGAAALEKLVKIGIQRDHEAGLAARVQNGKLTGAGEVLRHVLLNTTVNLLSSRDRSEGTLITGLPADFFLPFGVLKDTLGIPGITAPALNLDYRAYRGWLASKESRLENDAPPYKQPGDTTLAFFVPVPSHEDSVVLGLLLDQKWVSRKLVAAAQMVDFQNPVLSTRRSKLQSYASQVTEASRLDGPRSIDVQLATLIEKGAAGQPPCDPAKLDACTPERQFLHYYKDDKWEATIAKTVNDYMAAVAAKLKQDKGESYLTLAAARRRVFTRWPASYLPDDPAQSAVSNLAEFTLLFPKTNLPDEVYRMRPNGEIEITQSP